MCDNVMIRAFIEEAKAITTNHSFAGMPNKSMFWAHTEGSYPLFPYERNNFLCALYVNSVDPQTYKLDTLDSIDQVNAFFSRYQRDYPPIILDAAWDVFSRAFAQQVLGDHIFVAANDMKPNDFFVRVELPELEGRIKNVTTIEPIVDQSGMLACKTTSWLFSEWKPSQQRQWNNHDHYLDGQIYPPELRSQRCPQF